MPHLPLSSADIKEDDPDEGVVSPPLSPPRGSAKDRTAIAQLLQSSQKSMTPLGSTIHEFFFPDELLLYVFSFLDIQSLCKCGSMTLPFLRLASSAWAFSDLSLCCYCAAQVSTDWRRLTNDAVLWTELHIRRHVKITSVLALSIYLTLAMLARNAQMGTTR